jgi:hypothetical protein
MAIDLFIDGNTPLVNQKRVKRGTQYLSTLLMRELGKWVLCPQLTISWNSIKIDPWAINSVEECYLHTVEVTGSNPVSPIFFFQQLDTRKEDFPYFSIVVISLS